MSDIIRLICKSHTCTHTHQISCMANDTCAHIEWNWVIHMRRWWFEEKQVAADKWASIHTHTSTRTHAKERSSGECGQAPARVGKTRFGVNGLNDTVERYGNENEMKNMENADAERWLSYKNKTRRTNYNYRHVSNRRKSDAQAKHSICKWALSKLV